MHRAARQAAILDALATRDMLSVAGLAEDLAVSRETIRRDIKAMAGRGLVEQVHGGVTRPDLLREPDFQKRLATQAEAKRRIARALAGRISDGDSLILDTGSTTLYVAQALGDRRNLRVVTNGTEIARVLARNPGNEVYLAGGEFRADDAAAFGTAAIHFVERFRVRRAILSIGAIDIADGFMDFHVREAEFSRAVMARAREVIVVADASKFAIAAPVKVCDLGEVDTLVTNRLPSLAVAARLEAAGVEVVVCAPERG